MESKKKIKVIPLGGLGEIGKNITVIEYGDEIVVVDCGMTFPDSEMYGIDVVIPDVTYLVNNIESLEIDSNWNIPVEGKISGVFCGFIDNHSFELLGEDGNYYAVSTLKLTNEDFSELESEKTNITIEYIIEDEGSQLTLLKIIEKN